MMFELKNGRLIASRQISVGTVFNLKAKVLQQLIDFVDPYLFWDFDQLSPMEIMRRLGFIVFSDSPNVACTENGHFRVKIPIKSGEEIRLSAVAFS
ncbi:hypothetical protein [Pleionea sp. CnH1-48]|uniref:hypothetical protein n=1 Tax=Pleionea sp. CnH1-48 TaxID=2954494 RepID=UPI0020975DA7|nr:hypothetical protein [Pleionea sp. CnH1-48]MCO7224416.1 hypothetical protein [Pleionea sp. CnH1-48]